MSQSRTESNQTDERETTLGQQPLMSEQQTPKASQQKQLKFKQAFEAFHKRFSKFREDSQNYYALVKPNALIIQNIISVWIRRPQRTEKFVMILELKEVDQKELSLASINQLFKGIGSIKLIVNGSVIQNDAILIQHGQYVYEGIQQCMHIVSDSNKTFFFGEVRKISETEYRYHGKGILTIGNSKEGFQYIGTFDNGKKHGQGRMKMKMSVYQGQFKNDYKHGRGRETIFKKKKKNVPQPTIVVKSVYQGEFKQGYREGQGQEVMVGVYQYTGDWKHGEKCGKGSIKYKNGDTYEGNWQKDVFEGQGIYVQSENCTYTGEFKNGKYHGKGVMQYKRGDRYEGFFQNGKKHGQGKYDWDGGQDYYDGDWKNDSADGVGCSMIDGQYYSGEFRNGKRHGEGQLNTLDGDYIRAIWEDGEIIRQIERNGQMVEA